MRGATNSKFRLNVQGQPGVSSSSRGYIFSLSSTFLRNKSYHSLPLRAPAGDLDEIFPAIGFRLPCIEHIIEVCNYSTVLRTLAFEAVHYCLNISFSRE